MNSNLVRVIFAIVIYGAITTSCNKKEETVYQYVYTEAPPPATTRDTAITVNALLNNNLFSALGRALPPVGKISMSFYDFASSAFLEIALSADTPGTYLMGRSIAANTAVYYPDMASKLSKKGFTSRATDSASGLVRITEVDTVHHRIKGVFELLLLSRTDSRRFQFQQGTFDILYNHCEVTLNDSSRKASIVNASGLSVGTAVAPAPQVIVYFPDSLSIDIQPFKINPYNGPGKYTLQSNDIIATDKYNKKYRVTSGTVDLIRLNYGEFVQAYFDCILKANDSTILKISNGSFVVGNIQ